MELSMAERQQKAGGGRVVAQIIVGQQAKQNLVDFLGRAACTPAVILK